MLKYHNFDIVCQEIPDELTLAINITCCPIRCEGCHSKWLWKDVGTILNVAELRDMLKCYGDVITCVCFMGGDQAPKEVEDLAKFLSRNYPSLRRAWYSGREEIPDGVDATTYDYIKLGPDRAYLGGLDNPDTNQCIYHVEKNGKMTDITYKMQRKAQDPILPEEGVTPVETKPTEINI